MAEPTYTALDVIELDSLYPTAGAGIVWDPADDENGNTFVCTGNGREVLLVRNVSVDTAHNITVTSYPNSYGRTGDLTEEIAFGDTLAYSFAVKGWRGPDRTIIVTADDPDIEFAVIRLPRG